MAMGHGKWGSARTVAVFGSGSAPPDHPVLGEAERLGKGLAEAGCTLMNGGYGGTMEASSRGARKAAGEVIGVTMDLFAPRLQPNQWLTKEQRVKDFFPRLKHLTSADAFRAETFCTDRDLALATVVADVDEALAVLGDAFAPSP